jgi:hypothetical protein
VYIFSLRFLWQAKYRLLLFYARIGQLQADDSLLMVLCWRSTRLFVFPCHRVIGSSGKLTGFAGGLEVKKKLLDLEENRDHSTTKTD